MDPLMRKLFQPREAREKLRGMGGIMSSSPQLASTVAKFQEGGPILSRGLATPSAPDQPLPPVGPARATRIGDRTFVLTGYGMVLDAQTGEQAPQEIAAEVRRRLNPQLSMADIVGAEPEYGVGGVNPSFREDTSGQLPPMPPVSMSEPADPNAEFYSRQYNLGPSAEPRTADPSLEDGQGADSSRFSLSNIGPNIETLTAPFSGRTGIRAMGDGILDGILDDVRYTSDAILSPFTGSSSIADEEMLDASRRSAEEVAEMRARQGITESLGRPGMDSGPAEGLEPITRENLLPPEQDDSQDPPPENLDPNDPATFDTTYDQMLTRLQSVMGTKDEDSRQKAMANLAMIGLAIAAGQSPNALTNIAQGALTGVKAIREEQAESESQDKALRMAALNAALEQEQGVRSADAQLARDDLKFQRDIALEQEKARLGGGGGRDPRAIEDFVQNVYTEALKAASGVAPPPDMPEGEAPEAYAARKADTARQYMGQQFPNTYGGGGAAADPIMTRVQEALQGGADPARLRADFVTQFPNLDPSAYGL